MSGQEKYFKFSFEIENKSDQEQDYSYKIFYQNESYKCMLKRWMGKIQSEKFRKFLWIVDRKILPGFKLTVKARSLRTD